MFSRVMSAVSIMVMTIASASLAQTQNSNEIVTQLVEAYGGEEFAGIGILKLEVAEEETTNDGVAHSRSYTLFVDTSNLSHSRMELPGAIVIACGMGGCWATQSGELDSRPQAPGMARKTLNQTVFGLLFPFSLSMQGVRLDEGLGETHWEGREAWVLPIDVPKGLFASPIMTTTWYVFVAKDDFSFLAAHFLPPVEFQKVQTEGIRYRILKNTNLEEARIPSQILLGGIDLGGVENGHVSVTRIDASIYGPSEPTLFMSPE